MGSVPREQLFLSLADYDVGISYIPFGRYDTAPALKTLEYLACGLPVLATNTFGNRMFVRSGENGWLADDDPVSFASGIVDIVNNSNLNVLASVCRDSVIEYDWNYLALNRLLPAYEKITSS